MLQEITPWRAVRNLLVYTCEKMVAYRMIDFTNGKWIYEPKQQQVTAETVEIVTEPETDFWQRTYYGFRNDNAPALLLESAENFTFTVKAGFVYRALFDQCGLAIYLNSDCLLYTSPSPRDRQKSRMPSSA